MIASFWRRLGEDRYHYVLVSTVTSLISFARNILFMRTLGLFDLGQIALMQTIVMLIGFVQLGLINGTYILYAEQDLALNQKIINLLWTGIGFLLVVVAVAAGLGGSSLGMPVVAPETLLVAAVAGIATLAANFLNNALIAEGALTRSNIVNVVAVVASVGIAALSLPYGLPAALLSILSQPLLMALGAILLDPRLRPVALAIDREVLRRVFALGIMPFIGSLFVLLSYQVERWAIVRVLGPEALGQFYLVMMYMTFFLLIPVSLMNMHFSNAMRAYQIEDADLFRSILRRHMRELLLYCGAALFVTAVALHWVLQKILPQFVGSEILVFLIYPAMVIWVLRDTASLALYAARRTVPILISGGIFLGVYTALVLASIHLNSFSLQSLVLMRGVAVVISTICLFWARYIFLRGEGLGSPKRPTGSRD